MVAACACGGPPLLPKKIKREKLEVLTTATGLKPKEVKALYARFRRLAPTGYLLPDQFKQTLGVIGLTDDPFLPDRMFRVFDEDQDGKLSFDEFATSLAIMIRGSEEQKLKLSFEMAAGNRGAPGISFEDFQCLINACNTMMSSLVAPSDCLTSEEDIRRLFHDLTADEHDSPSEADKLITLESYKLAAQSNEEFLNCLGLEPSHHVMIASPNTRMSRRNTPNLGNLKNRRKSNPHGSPPATPNVGCGVPVLGSPSPSPVPVDVRAAIPTWQIDEIRGRVCGLRKAVLRQREAWNCLDLYGPRSPSMPSDLPAASQTDDDDPDERWWTPLNRKAKENAITPHGGALRLDDICAELDKVVGWCNQYASEPLGHEGPGTYCGGVTSGSDSEWPPSRRMGYSTDTNPNSVCRELSRGEAGHPDTPQLKMQRSNVHGAKPSHSDGTTRSSKKRYRKRHRLLGPKKGLAVHFGHENWNMVLSMMIGIRMSVGRSKHEIARELQPVDFVMKEKFSIIPRLANIFDSAVSKRVTMTRFIDYAPMVFQKIRSSFGIHHDEYLRSVGPEQLLGNMVLGNLSSLSELSSEGKSGAFFYYTADGKYMMKTVTPKEQQLLKRMLKKYYDHTCQNPGTLIVRFLGLHCLRVQKYRKGVKSLPASTRKLYFVVMGNMFNAPFEIHRRYDLKGSWVGRVTPPQDYDASVALKDVDFQQANERVRIGGDRRTRLLQQLELDSLFLAEQHIIDYSLLLGIHEVGAGDEIEETLSDCGCHLDGEVDVDGPPLLARPPRNSKNMLSMSPGGSQSHQLRCSEMTNYMPNNVDIPVHQKDMGGMLSSDKRSLYFLGIIDILTPYDTLKKVEHHFKALRHDRQGVSCCPPSFYAERFNKFMKNAFV